MFEVFNDSLSVAQFQLIFTVVLWIWAILSALYIFRRQNDLSKAQWKIIDRQVSLLEKQIQLWQYTYNIENARYSLNKLANNFDTNLLQHISWSLTKYMDQNKAVVLKAEKDLKNIDKSLSGVKFEFDKAEIKYRESLDNRPEWFKLDKEE